MKRVTLKSGNAGNDIRGKPISETAGIGNTVKLSSASSSDETFDLSDRPTFHVVIIYEDSRAGMRAKHCCDSIIQELEDECDCSLELWNFRSWRFQRFGNSAARAAAKADFLILSINGRSPLCVQTRDWIINGPN
jgi:hypothetical protein